VALITGACSGLGEGMAPGLAEAGVDVAGIYAETSPRPLKEKMEGLTKLLANEWAKEKTR
jgi:NAD(P)-dependent dehydrogenase (short-subunit alcohol dehydrogenase family)